MSDEKFNKPLDTEIMEPTEIEEDVLHFDPKTHMVSRKKVKSTIFVRTKYHKAVVSKLLCKPKTHFYEMTDIHTYLAKCINCKKRRFMNAAYETIKEGHIIDRATKKILD